MHPLLQQLSRRAVPWVEAAARLLYPPHCVVCGRANHEDEDRYICRDCLLEIDYVRDPTCPRCGHELGPHAKPGRRCVVCRGIPLRFDRAVAAAHHAGPARDMVLSLKFGGRTQNALPLSTLLAQRLLDVRLLETVQFLVPVPLHRSRLRSRGFDQACLIAEELADQLALPVVTKALHRVVNTPPQTRTMSLRQRRVNVKGAFAVRNPAAVAGRSILLVDDVLTTGATTSECAGVLKRAGARRVYVATVTRRMGTPPRSADDEAPACDLPVGLGQPPPGTPA